MSRISRETLKWLQSLDINPGQRTIKRLISNGYVIAQILSMHYPTTMDLSTYIDTQELAAKLHNWECLFKAFQLNNIPIKCSVLEANLHGREAAAELLLHLLHRYFTGKSFDGLPHSYHLEDAYERSLPNYARSTAIQYIRKNIPSTDEKNYLDNDVRCRKVHEMIEKHNLMMTQSREKLFPSCADMCLRYVA